MNSYPELGHKVIRIWCLTFDKYSDPAIGLNMELDPSFNPDMDPELDHKMD